MSSTQVPPSVYARLNLAGEDDDSPEAEVERLLAEARAGRQEAEVEVDEEDLAMDEEEFEELLAELEEEELEEAEAADVRRFERAEAKRQRNAVPICQRCHGLRHQKKGGEATRARAGATDDALTPEAFETLILCGNQNFKARSSTPSTRRLLDGVAMPVPHRSTGPARPRHHREMS